MALLLFADNRAPQRLRTAALMWSVATFLLALWAYSLQSCAAPGEHGFALTNGEGVRWLGGDGVAAAIDIRYHVGIDGVSMWLLLLTTFLTPLAIWGSFTGITTRVKEFYALMLLLETGMLGVFVSLDFFLFYVFWEVMLLPMYFLIGVWGGARKEYAAIKFFLFTLAGSVLMLVALVAMYFYSGDAVQAAMDAQGVSEIARDRKSVV